MLLDIINMFERDDRTHETDFTIAELVDVTDVTRSTVWRAVDLLHEIGVVEIRETPQRNYVTINRDRLEKEDPVLAIEQSEFQDPVRTFVEQVHEAVSESEEIEDLVGIIRNTGENPRL
jgi:predicted transcriptional regulator